MLISELLPLTEKIVDSSWISDVTYIRPKRTDDERKSKVPKKADVRITVKDGRTYTVKDVPYQVYRNWQRAESKGSFWHKFINNKYVVV